MSILLGAGVGNRARGPAYIVRDTFTDADGTAIGAHDPDIDQEGGGWIAARWGNIITIQSNRADGSDWANHGGNVIDVGQDEFTIEVIFYPKDGTYEGWVINASGAGVGDFDGWCIIYDPPNNRFRADDSYPGGGGEGNKGVYAAALDETGATAYNIKITKVGSTVTCYIDDVEMFSWTSAKWDGNTYVGFYGWTTDNTMFDDFRVY